MAPTPSVDQLRKQVQLTSKKRALRRGQALAFRCSPGWTGGESLEIGSKRYRVREAQSPLEVREALLEAEEADEPLVVLTDLSENQLAEDIRARLDRQRLREIDLWMVLAEAFKATRMDDRLRGKEHLALSLLEHEPEGGYPTAPAGFLDASMVWDAAMRHVLCLPSGQPLPKHLVSASLDEESVAAIRSADARLVNECSEWLADERGLKTSAFLLTFLRAENAADCLPIGLACQVVFHESGVTETALRQAEVRLEAIVGQPVPRAVGREWGDVSASLLTTMDEASRNRLRRRGDVILGEAQAQEYAFLSDCLPSGYDQRLNRFADALDLKDADEEAVQHLSDMLGEVRLHVEGRPNDHRNQKVAMAARLALWLQQPHELPAALPEAADQYVSELAFVDWARDALVGGDPVAKLQRAYQRLTKEVTARREAFNERFGQLVSQWSGAREAVSAVLLIEDFLNRVLVPATQTAPGERVLLLVVDGMAWGTCHELLSDLEANHGWVPATNEGAMGFGKMGIRMLSTMPCVTEYARTSLLCGRLTTGDAAEESAGFPTHDGVKEICSTNNPARLFHKPDLEEEGRQGLHEDVQKSIANAKNRIVGIVFNAVDDFLLRSDQTRHTWTVNDIRLLEAVLTEARKSKRLLILASDHGHILDRDTTARPSEDGGERWQQAEREPDGGEVAVSGPRVAPYGQSIVVPWTETIRYGAKRNGYHGGAAPQELVAPCCILTHTDFGASDWVEVSRGEPSWWTVAPAPAVELPPAVDREAIAAKARRRAKGQRSLFEATEKKEAMASRPWPARLIDTELFKANLKLAGRRVPDASVAQTVLDTLDAAGGQVPTGVLAGRLNMPEVRLQGLVAQLQRVLNVDGYPCIGFTRDGAHVSMDKPLLLKQFQIEADG